MLIFLWEIVREELSVLVIVYAYVSIYAYIYVCMCAYMYVYVYVNMYIRFNVQCLMFNVQFILLYFVIK